MKRGKYSRNVHKKVNAFLVEDGIGFSCMNVQYIPVSVFYNCQ